jgi:GDP-D-mannose dehydratase
MKDPFADLTPYAVAKLANFWMFFPQLLVGS